MKTRGRISRSAGCLSLLSTFIAVLLVAKPAFASCGSHDHCAVGEVCEAGACVREAATSPVQPGPDTQPAGTQPIGQPGPTYPEPQAAPYVQPNPNMQPAPYGQPSPNVQPAPYGYQPIPPATWAPPPLPPARSEPAGAEPEIFSFGGAGQVVFWGSGGATLSSASSGYTNSSTTTSSSNINLSPNVGFFLSNLILLEAAVEVWRQSDSTVNYYGFDLESGLGFSVPVGQKVSILPEFRLGGGWAKYNYTSASSTDHDYFHYWGSIGMPVLFHVAPHFFIGGGPVFRIYDSKLNTPGSTVYETVRVTLQASIGGWF